MKISLHTKPLSTNKLWQGRRFKTRDYIDYEREVAYLLPRDSIKGFVQIEFNFYLKNFGNTDVSNLIKGLEDILVKRGIIEDDRKVIKLTATKHKSSVSRVEIDIKSYPQFS